MVIFVERKCALYKGKYGNCRVKGPGGPPYKTDWGVHCLALECKFQMFELALGVSRKNANILKTLWGTRKEMEKKYCLLLIYI